MNTLKRISILLLIGLLSFSAVFISYTGIKNGAVVFADSTTASWTQVTTTDELARAFRYYCESRDLTIDGSQTDATTTWTTRQFALWCEKTGIDVTGLQAHIKYYVDGNGLTKFLYDASGIDAMNRVFGQFLQDYNLNVGDTVNEDIYSGYVYTDYEGHNHVMTVLKTPVNTYPNVQERGLTFYPYSYLTSCVNNGTAPPSVTLKTSSSDTYTFTYSYSPSGRYNVVRCSIYKNGSYQTETVIVRKEVSSGNTENPRDISIGYASGTYYFCALRYNEEHADPLINFIPDNGGETISTPFVVNITTDNDVINNNNYSGNTYTTINNEGDVNNYDTDNEPSPDSGGGGGDTPDPPTPPSGNVNDWGVELPNLDIPWYLYGKEDKFPWNIPFNIMLTLSLLKAEPQAPHFEGTMDFKFTTYDYDIDLAEFDPVASVMRKLEIVAFLIGLMVLTKRLIDW